MTTTSGTASMSPPAAAPTTTRFTRKEIGVIAASLRVIGLSSCAIYSLLLIDIVLLRAEYPTIIDTIGLGVRVPLSRINALHTSTT